jgi:multicomponent K+:H+ antiporter subunit E
MTQPVTSLVLLIVWLLASNRLSAGLVLTGVVLALAIPRITARFWPEAPRTVRLMPLLSLLGVVLYDILIANVRVAYLVLGPQDRPRPAFFEVPVDARDPFTISLLASVISLTPGTVTTAISNDRTRLLVHGLDVDDVETTIHDIKSRYERRLREVFE